MQKNSNDEDVLKLLEKLETDRNRLAEQRDRFSALLVQLEIRGKEEVENRKRTNEKLNLEVTDLKRKCEKLSIFINTESDLECIQAGV